MCRLSRNIGTSKSWNHQGLYKNCFTSPFTRLCGTISNFLHLLPSYFRFRSYVFKLTVKTYLLTPWSRVLLEKLTGSAASQEIPRIFGTRMFITLLTSARHLSLFWANSIQSSQTPPTSWRSILISSSHLRLGLPNGLFPSGFTVTFFFSWRYHPHWGLYFTAL